MLTIDRWRNWRPSDEKFEDSPGCELTKLTKVVSVSFVSSTSEQMQNFSDRPPDAPDAWREDFARWMAKNCVHREGREDWDSVGTC